MIQTDIWPEQIVSPIIIYFCLCHNLPVPLHHFCTPFWSVISLYPTTTRGNIPLPPLLSPPYLTPLMVTTIQRDVYHIRVVASDRGFPPLSSEVEVELSIVDRNYRAPVWDQRVYGPVTVTENVSVGKTIHSIKARFVFSLTS